MEVDLHLALAPLARCRIDYGAVWTQAERHRIGATETRVLCRPHAAIFQALHMAIDHFDVPAIYLLDLARLLVTREQATQARALAQAWHCDRPLGTALALLAAFVPASPAADALERPAVVARWVTAGYGGLAPLPRAAQLVRKLLHFDSPLEVAGYVVVQTRRNLRETFERRVRRRSPRERLRLARRAPMDADPGAPERSRASGEIG
jgi:hypothetical protein